MKEIKRLSSIYIVVPRIDELDEEEMQVAKKLNLRSVSSRVKSIKDFLKEK